MGVLFPLSSNKPPTYKYLRILSLTLIYTAALPRSATTMELRNDLDTTAEQQVREESPY